MHNRSFVVRRKSSDSILFKCSLESKNSHSVDAGKEEKIAKGVKNSRIACGLETKQGVDIMKAIGFGVELPSRPVESICSHPEDVGETSQAASGSARNVNDLFQDIEEFLEQCLV